MAPPVTRGASSSTSSCAAASSPCWPAAAPSAWPPFLSGTQPSSVGSWASTIPTCSGRRWPEPAPSSTAPDRSSTPRSRSPAVESGAHYLDLTAALDGGSRADEVEVAIGLDRWWPTAGTRATGTRNTATRLVIRDGALTALEAAAPSSTWSYPSPLGDQSVVQMPFSEVITIDRHLDVGELRSYLNTASLEDLRDGATPAPASTDEHGRSAQQFVVDVVVRRGTETRRASATGRDIYAVSAPIVVEGAVRLLDGRHRGPGAAAPGEAFDAADVLATLERDAGAVALGSGSNMADAIVIGGC